MSGIYIPNMETSTDCNNCPFCEYEQGGCMAFNNKSTLPQIPGKRADWCPLIPVPDHGRLIDADELKLHKVAVLFPNDGLGISYLLAWNDAIDAITDNAPTIIAADEQEGE